AAPAAQPPRRCRQPEPSSRGGLGRTGVGGFSLITVLTGGTGGAKFAQGLMQVPGQDQLTFVVNTGDDLLWWGLYVSPDLDSITYALAGVLSRERGWGVEGDTFFCLERMRTL